MVCPHKITQNNINVILYYIKNKMKTKSSTIFIGLITSITILSGIYLFLGTITEKEKQERIQQKEKEADKKNK